MLCVVTHVVSPAIQDCELTFVKRWPIRLEKAMKQHDRYCAMLEQCGARVIRLTGNSALPDSVFVEDPIIVFDEVAVLTSMGIESRRRECRLLERFFRQHRPIEHISLPARIEGGDVLKIGRRIYVGESLRTNRQGIQALGELIVPLGYEVIPVRVSGCLHLKTGCTALDDKTVLMNPGWIDRTPFQQYRILETQPTEPFAANVLPIGDSVCMNGACPETIALVNSRGYRVATADISEFAKAEAGLTCMSLPFLREGVWK